MCEGVRGDFGIGDFRLGDCGFPERDEEGPGFGVAGASCPGRDRRNGQAASGTTTDAGGIASRGGTRTRSPGKDSPATPDEAHRTAGPGRPAQATRDAARGPAGPGVGVAGASCPGRDRRKGQVASRRPTDRGGGNGFAGWHTDPLSGEGFPGYTRQGTPYGGSRATRPSYIGRGTRARWSGGWCSRGILPRS